MIVVSLIALIGVSATDVVAGLRPEPQLGDYVFIQGMEQRRIFDASDEAPFDTLVWAEGQCGAVSTVRYETITWLTPNGHATICIETESSYAGDASHIARQSYYWSDDINQDGVSDLVLVTWSTLRPNSPHGQIESAAESVVVYYRESIKGFAGEVEKTLELRDELVQDVPVDVYQAIERQVQSQEKMSEAWRQRLRTLMQSQVVESG